MPKPPQRLDPRLFQIASLGTLLAANMAWFDFGARPGQGAVMLLAALGAQAGFCRAFRVRFDPLSPVITGLSLSLLLRTGAPALWVLAPVLAVGSKFLLRVRGKHLFNPAAFAIAALLLGADGVWVSPGQWGSAAWLGLLVASAGGMVLTRAARLDTALGFLLCFGGLLAWRAWMLGDPWAIPLHQVQSGSLLLFAFFMVTDPRSTPDSRAGRLLFAAAVAGVAHWLMFTWQVRPGLYFALVGVSCLTPLIDLALPGQQFRWRPAPAAGRPAPGLLPAAPQLAKASTEVRTPAPAPSPLQPLEA